MASLAKQPAFFQQSATGVKKRAGKARLNERIVAD
jgi:hypothetical protein